MVPVERENQHDGSEHKGGQAGQAGQAGHAATASQGPPMPSRGVCHARAGKEKRQSDDRQDTRVRTVQLMSCKVMPIHFSLVRFFHVIMYMFFLY